MPKKWTEEMKAKARATRERNGTRTGHKTAGDPGGGSIITYLRHIHDSIMVEIREGNISKISRKDALALLAYAEATGR